MSLFNLPPGRTADFSRAVELDEEPLPTILHVAGACGHMLDFELGDGMERADVEQVILLAGELPCGPCRRRTGQGAVAI